MLERLSRTVGRDEESFCRAAESWGGVRAEAKPRRYLFRFFPLFELHLLRYEGDEDFPPYCNVLFPDNMLALFSAEDAIVAAEQLVRCLEGKGPRVEG